MTLKKCRLCGAETEDGKHDCFYQKPKRTPKKQQLAKND